MQMQFLFMDLMKILLTSIYFRTKIILVRFRYPVICKVYTHIHF